MASDNQIALDIARQGIVLLKNEGVLPLAADTTARIAVIGSEPQIYFYAHRRSASGFIYVYDLVQLHRYAGPFQREMIGEIERAQPRPDDVAHADIRGADSRGGEGGHGARLQGGGARRAGQLDHAAS